MLRQRLETMRQMLPRLVASLFASPKNHIPRLAPTGSGYQVNIGPHAHPPLSTIASRRLGVLK